MTRFWTKGLKNFFSVPALLMNNKCHGSNLPSPKVFLSFTTIENTSSYILPGCSYKKRSVDYLIEFGSPCSDCYVYDRCYYNIRYALCKIIVDYKIVPCKIYLARVFPVSQINRTSLHKTYFVVRRVGHMISGNRLKLY